MKAWRRWTWKSPNGVPKTEIPYVLTNRPDIVTDVTVLNTSTLEVTTDWPSRRQGGKENIDDQVATRIGSKKIEFQLKLRTRFETLQDLDDIDIMRESHI